MILTGPQIIKELELGRLHIDPYSPASIQPNGYDFHLDPQLRCFDEGLDFAHPPQGQELTIDPESGLLLEPHKLYLGLTSETFNAPHHALWLFGDRSLGSLGVWVQVSAPLGHVGSKIRWTLEIKVICPVRVYSGMVFGKVCFLVNKGFIKPYGDADFPLSGKYLRNELVSSQLSLESPLGEES